MPDPRATPLLHLENYELLPLRPGDKEPIPFRMPSQRASLKYRREPPMSLPAAPDSHPRTAPRARRTDFRVNTAASGPAGDNIRIHHANARRQRNLFGLIGERATRNSGLSKTEAE